jgi:hypothetical protein
MTLVNGKKYTALSREAQIQLEQLQELLVISASAPSSGGATEAKQDDIITALGTLALEVTADQINLNTDTLETSNDAIQAAVEGGVVETPSMRTVTNTTGSVTAGKKSFTIYNVGSADGTVDGDTIPKKTSVSFSVTHFNNTLGAIAFDATGTEFLIAEIV